MKLLSIVIPCYNSEKYMKKAIESALLGGESVEIIIVDDGSQDNTAEIGDKYAEEYANIRCIHKENGGHGDAVMAGLTAANGIFFKVLDSDDSLDGSGLAEVLAKLSEAEESNSELDMLLTNYVYDKQTSSKKKVMRYTGSVPVGKYIDWNKQIRMKPWQYILMHSVIYRTSMLKSCDFSLPKHTFYVDNIFVFHPLPYIRKLYYLDVNFYMYYIGRNDQSVNEQIMIGRRSQQFKVTEIMLDRFIEHPTSNKMLEKYMFHYLDMMMCICSILCILDSSNAALSEKKAFWHKLKKKNLYLYRKLRTTLFGIWMNLPGKLGRWFSVAGYRLMHLIYGFN